MNSTAEPSLLIVVPTLNSHTLLPRLVHSLQQQTWPHWQVLFIDGPSCSEHRRWLQQCCSSDSRCRWIEQDPAQPGIFGAMNQGFASAAFEDWLLFWGSDDWAASPQCLHEAMISIASAIRCPDLLVCKGRYADACNLRLGRTTRFQSSGLLDSFHFRLALLFGSTPPHQATLFGPGARSRLSHYSEDFRLAADLDYFLQLSRSSDLRVQCLDLELVHMADAGVSGQQTQRRLQEVCLAYRRSFSSGWWFAFVARYIRRLASLSA